MGDRGQSRRLSLILSFVVTEGVNMIRVYAIDVAKAALISIASQGYSAPAEIANNALKRIAELEAKKA